MTGARQVAFTRQGVIPAGSVFIVEVPSGYGYSFWNVCHVEEDLVLVQKRTLGYTHDDGGGFYVGKYRCHLSELKGCSPESIRWMYGGSYESWEDIPDDVHAIAKALSELSLRSCR